MRPKHLVVVAAVALLATAALSYAAPPAPTVVSVSDAAWGETATAVVSPQDRSEYVFTQCWLLDGTYVYAAYFPIVNGEAVLGPLTSTLWPNEAASCRATAGWFRRNGFGKWVEEGVGTFSVVAA